MRHNPFDTQTFSFVASKFIQIYNPTLCYMYRSIRVFARADALFTRETDNVVTHASATFVTHPQDVDAVDNFDIATVLKDLNKAVENWNSRGSGYNIKQVTRFTLCICKHRPLHGSTWVPTPKFIRNKHCVINVKCNDDQCFVYAVLAALYPQNSNPQRMYTYAKYRHLLNLEGLQFPLQLKQIPKFEKQNPSLSVNVLYYDNDTKDFTIEYLSSERGREQHINLLLLGDAVSPHFVWIKNMSALVSHRTKHKGYTYVCNSCLTPFSSQCVLDKHIPFCHKHSPQQVVYPSSENERDCTLKFNAHKKEYKLPFYLICDFESFLTPTDNDNDCDTKAMWVVDEHNVSGFASYRVTDIEQYQTTPYVYSGEHVMEEFYNHVMSESAVISSILGATVPMLSLTKHQRDEYNQASVCGNCHEAFTATNWKTRHHCHVSGNYLFPACNNCNLQLKVTKSRRRKRNDDGKTDYVENYFLPIIFHNLKGYDSHFIIKHFKKEYTEHLDDGGKTVHDDIKIIPLSGEKCLMFQVGNLRFLDSYQFMSAKLEELVSLLLKSGKHNFRHTTKYMGDSDIVFAKGVFPYSYMTCREKFLETKLPPIEAFYDKLRDEILDENDYARAREIWQSFKIQSLQQYHDHYLVSDVLLLADVFENFRNSVFNKHNLDCLHFVTLPSLAWVTALKYTGVKLDLITDPSAYLMIENSMRGGIATISQRHAVANNPCLEDYDANKPHNFITYLDANSLYATAQCEPLPLGDFRFLDNSEIEDFELMAIQPESPTGYIIECDLVYPDKLHDKHSDYPLAPDHLTVVEEMLSPYSKNLINPDMMWKPSKKLVPNLLNKTQYVTHYRNLQLYVQQGLEVTKIHRILSFSQSPWLKPWIDLCNEQRRAATSDFESDLAKLQANATFGKTMENVRHRVNIRLIADPHALQKAVSKASFRESVIINEDLVMVRGARNRVMLNKPIAVGFAILEISKLIMFKFYYEYLKPKYENRCSLLFTDTDSLCCQIYTRDLYEDMHEDLDLFDTSNFETDHPLYSTANYRRLGKFKSETGSTTPKEFIGLRAKMYSLFVPNNTKKCQRKVKGVQKHYVKKNVRHENFLEVLRRTKSHTTCKFHCFRSTNHIINTVEMSKVCLSAFDDKRYILDDSVHTLAHGHYTLRK